ncbi:MAG: hypothetical protein AVDCRST_MAG73-1924 [uncultured Thermomicrobiales bacterium]|uniref:Uncharacterized protein n=1 Tax=uncultured Thermomicrobiales bacterium TaxID=1645740 RepID=A0A6J4U5Y9_9BACT|nr:MAG: hypothetical protein AVDCRST_MAG73-1924 [uncultured Thermomicrobiales bacterium]
MVATHQDATSVARTTVPVSHDRAWDETKASFKTTELWAFVAAVVGVLYAANEAGNFAADQAWTLVTALTIGYMVSRGLAKAGSRHTGDD